MPKEKSILVRQSMELLQFLLSLPEGLSRKDAKNLLRFKAVAVPGVPAPRHDTPLKKGMEVRIALGKHTPAGTVLPSGVEILFEDEALIVINKPAGLLTIATESEQNRTAYAQLTAYVKARSPKGDARVFIVHRLDRDTSGLLIFARTEAVKFAFQKNWKNVTKKYHAIVEGELDPAEGTLRSALVESDTLQVHSTRPDREDAKQAITHYRTIRRNPEYSLVELTLDTGRKNQIRVQLADAGHPVVGDEKYGALTDPARRLALHAVELQMRHPETGEPLNFISPLPEKLRGLLGKRDPGDTRPRQVFPPAEDAQRPSRESAREPAERRGLPGKRDPREGRSWSAPAATENSRRPSREPAERREPQGRRDPRDSWPRPAPAATENSRRPSRESADRREPQARRDPREGRSRQAPAAAENSRRPARESTGRRELPGKRNPRQGWPGQAAAAAEKSRKPTGKPVRQPKEGGRRPDGLHRPVKWEGEESRPRSNRRRE